MNTTRTYEQVSLFTNDGEPRELTEKEVARLKRANANKRGRKKPAKVPSQLTRTAAFAPKRKGLITDSAFERTYAVTGPGGSVMHVMGRELGTQHRNALYALFRLKNIKVRRENPQYLNGQRNVPRYLVHYEVTTTWRELLRAGDKTIHANNLLSTLNIFEDMQKVVIRVQETNAEEITEEMTKTKLMGAGYSGNIIKEIKWEGVELDSPVFIEYGKWVKDMLQAAHIVSLNSEVQNKLTSDHAISFWPYIDSQPNHTYIEEKRLAEIAGRDLWGDHETAATRADFRKKCKQAFDNMVKCGGLLSYEIEITGYGKRKERKYHYKHALPRQIELGLDEEEKQETEATSTDETIYVVTAKLLEEGRKIAVERGTGWDINFIKNEFEAYAHSKGEKINNLETTWLGFVRKKTKHPPK